MDKLWKTYAFPACWELENPKETHKRSYEEEYISNSSSSSSSSSSCSSSSCSSSSSEIA